MIESEFSLYVDKYFEAPMAQSSCEHQGNDIAEYRRVNESNSMNQPHQP